MSPKYDFASRETPSFADMRKRIKSDARFPAARRAGALTSMNRALEWYSVLAKDVGAARGMREPPKGIDPERVPFDGPMLTAMFASFVPLLLGVSEKSIQNVKSELKFVERFYRLSRRLSFAPLTEEMCRACRGVRSQFDRYDVSRFLHYLAAHQIRIEAVDQQVFLEFCEALKGDWTIKNPEAIAARTRRTWNRLACKYSSWPQVRLSGGKRKQRWAMPFSAFPEIERESSAFLRRGLDNPHDFDGPHCDAPALRPATIVSQMQQYRTAASCLARSGVPVAEITDLRSLCEPIHFRRLLSWYIEHLGKANRSVKLLADLLLKTAKYAGVLERDEIEAVGKLHEKLAKRVAEFEKTKESKGEKLVAQFDDADVMDALIALAHDTVAKVAKSGKRGLMAAYAIQRALVLELWLAAPLRLSNILNLRIDKHFFWITMDGEDQLLLHIPAGETKNSRALDYLLHEDATKLFVDYLDRWRPMIVKGDSPYLFPGRNGGPKSGSVFALQMRKYIRRGCNVRFNPHLIRRVVAKLILDDEHGNLETARRQLGHADNRMLLNVYAQRQNRTIQKRYLKALQERKLSAVERLSARRRRHGS
jgi:integrase